MRIRDALTAAQRGVLLEAQGYRCCLCQKPFSSSRPPHLDHEHAEGLIRGFLCEPCNRALGYRHDDAEWFCRAGLYLKKPPAVDIIGHVYVPGSPGAEGVLDGQ